MGKSACLVDVVIDDSESLSRLALAGDSTALARLFDRERPRLRRMLRLRLDPRLVKRVDPDDVIQDGYVEILRRFDDYRLNHSANLPLSLWFRLVLAQRLVDLHRIHLGTRARDAALEISLHRGSWPQATSASLAARLLGKLTSASRAAIRAEQQIIVQEALNRMDAIDREVLVLRHFENLTNDQVASLLGLKKTAASQRYIRALQRLSAILNAIPGLHDDP